MPSASGKVRAADDGAIELPLREPTQRRRAAGPADAVGAAEAALAVNRIHVSETRSPGM
jgi:hypothetical protein